MKFSATIHQFAISLLVIVIFMGNYNEREKKLFVKVYSTRVVW